MNIWPFSWTSHSVVVHLEQSSKAATEAILVLSNYCIRLLWRCRQIFPPPKVKMLAMPLIVRVIFSSRFSTQTLFSFYWLLSTPNQVVQSSLLSWWIAIWDPISPALMKFTLPVPVAKISDFGMSRLYDPSKLSSTLTAIGHRRGYLPPEAYRLEEENYDNSLDVFSFGVILTQIVCKLETIKSAKDRSFHVAQIPHTHRLRKLIDSCLQEDMTRRPSARDICESIRYCIARISWVSNPTQKLSPRKFFFN